jgi:host factor-I protein
MIKTRTLQDTFLNQARSGKLLLTVFLMNGFQLRGVITGFDSFTVVLDSDGKQQLIYKHAISTIIPIRPIALEDLETAPDETPNETEAP